jgi:hypothetical protein
MLSVIADLNSVRSIALTVKFLARADHAVAAFFGLVITVYMSEKSAETALSLQFPNGTCAAVKSCVAVSA